MESKQKGEGLPSEEMKGADMELYCPVCRSTEAPLKKCCCFCKETETPLWRNGPLGPKSLCNACGIRYSKKRPRSSTAIAAAAGGGDIEERKRIVKAKLEEGEKGGPKECGEVERAALLLMALSCGTIF